MFKQGFFLTTIIEEQLPDEGGIDIYPDLDERIRDDWSVIGTAEGKSIIHVIDFTARIVRLNKDTTYLGKDYKHIAQQAKQGDINCQVVIDEIVFTNWEIDNPDYSGEGPPRINLRGKFKKWKNSGRPLKLTGWFPAHVWFGQDIEIPDDNDLEDD